jgi:ankyrin repeat protein
MNDIFNPAIAISLQFCLKNDDLDKDFIEIVNKFTLEKDLTTDIVDEYINKGGAIDDFCTAIMRGCGEGMNAGLNTVVGEYACNNNDNKFLECIKKHIEFETCIYEILLHRATEINAINQMLYLLDICKAEPNCMGHRNKTPLYYAIANHSLEAVKILLEHGADPNMKYGVCQFTYMDWAAYHHTNESIIAELLKYGANTNVKTLPNEYLR